MSRIDPSEFLRKLLVISGTIYAAVGPLTAAFIWLTTHLGVLPGLDQAGTIDVLVDASLVIGFLALAVVALFIWLASSTFSNDGIFFGFALSAWIAHFGAYSQAIGPFRFDDGRLAFTAPNGFYHFMTIVAAVLLVAQVINGFLNTKESEEAHPIRFVIVVLWTLGFGIPLLGTAWRWMSVGSISGFQAIPLAKVSGFGWLCVIVGSVTYGGGFFAFMSWRTKDKFKKDLQADLGSSAS